MPREHLGTHPLTETTCDYYACWCHKGNPPASILPPSLKNPAIRPEKSAESLKAAPAVYKYWRPLSYAYAAGVIVFCVAGFLVYYDGTHADAYIVATDRRQAIESILSCANVALPTRRQAEDYSASRPGTHVFEVRVK